MPIDTMLFWLSFPFLLFFLELFSNSPSISFLLFFKVFCSVLALFNLLLSTTFLSFDVDSTFLLLVISIVKAGLLSFLRLLIILFFCGKDFVLSFLSSFLEDGLFFSFWISLMVFNFADAVLILFVPLKGIFFFIFLLFFWTIFGFFSSFATFD